MNTNKFWPRKKNVEGSHMLKLAVSKNKIKNYNDGYSTLVSYAFMKKVRMKEVKYQPNCPACDVNYSLMIFIE
jgi:hypothetical protein